MDDQVVAQVEQNQIVCPACGRGFEPQKWEVRRVEGQAELREYGRVCPHCDTFNHGFVEDGRLRRRRATAEQRRREYEGGTSPGRGNALVKAMEEYERVFEETQARWRPVLGLAAISQTDPDETGEAGEAEE